MTNHIFQIISKVIFIAFTSQPNHLDQSQTDLKVSQKWLLILLHERSYIALSTIISILLLPHEYSLAIQQFHWQMTYFDMLHFF